MDEPVVFFGTGPVAAKSLELLAQWCKIEAVITKPKPEHHKGDFPVLTMAEQLGLPVHTVSNKRELDALMAGKPVKSRLGVLIDFGIIVSQQVIDYFPLGIINSHFSLLPEWRGADPITFSILSGQPRTGVSLMLLVQAMDEGPILSTGFYQMAGDETTPVLTEQLILLSDAMLKNALPKYVSGDLKPVDQSVISQQVPEYPTEPTYSRKLTKDDSILDFTKPAAQLEREIRAFADWPKSRTVLAGKDVVITAAHLRASEEQRAMNNEQSSEARNRGEAFVQDKQLCIQTGDGVLVIDALKPAGKGEMSGQAFLAGYGKHL